jgi:drug/metabolite transporter (DMT)-like permease
MLCLITFWGSSFVVVKIVLLEGMAPIAIATLRFLVAGGFFLVVLLLNRVRDREYTVRVNRRDVLTLMFLALAGVTFFFVFQYTGIQMAGASVAAIMVCLLSPVLISMLSARLLKETLNTPQILGVVVAAAGTFTIVIGGTFSSQADSSFLSGTLLLLATPILWAAYTIAGKRIMTRHSPFLIVAYVNILGGLFLVPFSLVEGSILAISAIGLNAWLAILFLASTCSLIGYYIWFYVMKRVRAAVVSSFLFAEPLITVLFATAFVGEQIAISTIGGGLLVFVGVYLVTRKGASH